VVGYYGLPVVMSLYLQRPTSIAELTLRAGRLTDVTLA
jgi:hypothetical protein